MGSEWHLQVVLAHLFAAALGVRAVLTEGVRLGLLFSRVLHVLLALRQHVKELRGLEAHVAFLLKREGMGHGGQDVLLHVGRGSILGERLRWWYAVEARRQLQLLHGLVDGHREGLPVLREVREVVAQRSQTCVGRRIQRGHGCAQRLEELGELDAEISILGTRVPEGGEELTAELEGRLARQELRWQSHDAWLAAGEQLQGDGQQQRRRASLRVELRSPR